MNTIIRDKRYLVLFKRKTRNLLMQDIYEYQCDEYSITKYIYEKIKKDSDFLVFKYENMEILTTIDFLNVYKNDIYKEISPRNIYAIVQAKDCGTKQFNKYKQLLKNINSNMLEIKIKDI
jgi:hypothetical protein